MEKQDLLKLCIMHNYGFEEREGLYGTTEIKLSCDLGLERLTKVMGFTNDIPKYGMNHHLERLFREFNDEIINRKLFLLNNE